MRDQVVNVKKILFVFMFAAAIVSISFSCSGEAYAAQKRIALVINGVLNAGDSGFNDICVKGLDMARVRHGKKISVKVYNAYKAEERLSSVLEDAAMNSDLVIVVPPEYADVMPAVVKKYSLVRFVAFDKMGIDGVKTVSFREEEGGFLAGALAAMLTKRGDLNRMNPATKIGIMLGKDVPAIQRFKKGYIAGAWYIDPGVEVICDYTDDFSSFAKGCDSAMDLHDKGADVIFAAAGACGLGAIHQAEANSYWVIGVDTEQETIFPDAVLTSVVKRSERVVSGIIDSYMKGTLDDSDISLGIKDGCIGLSTWTRQSKQNIPSDIRNELDTIEEKIADGLIIIK